MISLLKFARLMIPFAAGEDADPGDDRDLPSAFRCTVDDEPDDAAGVPAGFLCTIEDD